MARLTETNMSAAERKAFHELVRAVGFAPKIIFGRDANTHNHLLARLVEEGTATLYAVAARDSAEQMQNGNVREYRLLVAPVAAATQGKSVVSVQTRNRIRAKVRASWAARRARYGPSGKTVAKKEAPTP